MSDDPETEPLVLTSWPYEILDAEHGWLYYELGSYLATGRLIYRPNPELTARRLTQPWRWQQQRMSLDMPGAEEMCSACGASAEAHDAAA
jgi:hypothetical protein